MDTGLYVGFSSRGGLLPRLIRIFTGGAVNHAFLCWEDSTLGWVVLGANTNGVTLDTWSNFTATRKVPAIFKPVNGTLRTGLRALKESINAKYSTAGLVGMSVVEIARHLFNQRVANPLDVRGELFCSQFATMVIRASGYEFLPEWAADTIDPQEMMHELARRADFIQGVVPS